MIFIFGNCKWESVSERHFKDILKLIICFLDKKTAFNVQKVDDEMDKKKTKLNQIKLSVYFH